MSNEYIDIHVSKRSEPIPAQPYVDESLGKWFRPTLALAIAERGLAPVFSRGSEAYDFESGEVQALKPKIEKIDGVYQVTATAQQVLMESIRAIRNIAPVLGGGLPELNDPSVRALARDKAATNNLLQRHELGKEYALIGGADGIEAAMQTIAADNIVLKSRQGKGGAAYMGKKAAIAKLYNSTEFAKTREAYEWIIEEGLDMSPAMPLQGANATEQDKLAHINKLGLPKELRIYTFGRGERNYLITSAVLRAALPQHKNFGENERIYIDPESIPAEVVYGSDSIARSMEATTGVKEMHLAIDWAFAKKSSQDTPAWLPMEINGTEPVLVYESENAELARDQAAKLANQLYRIAEKATTKETN